MVTMEPGLSLISRVDTKVRKKELIVRCGCRVFNQVSAALLAGCRGKRDVETLQWAALKMENGDITELVQCLII